MCKWILFYYLLYIEVWLILWGEKQPWIPIHLNLAGKPRKGESPSVRLDLPINQAQYDPWPVEQNFEFRKSKNLLLPITLKVQQKSWVDCNTPGKYICFLGVWLDYSWLRREIDKWVLHGRNWQVHGVASNVFMFVVAPERKNTFYICKSPFLRAERDRVTKLWFLG